MNLETRAALSDGRSEEGIYRAVARALDRCGAHGTLVDVGCGRGHLWERVGARFSRYVGVDAVRYQGFPEGSLMVRADLDRSIPVRDGFADTVTSVETIEHLENPRALMRELVRIARPGGWIVVSTPNQLSALSLLTLLVKQRFAAFQDVHYPAHRTALLDVDLRRMAAECGLAEVRTEFSAVGRIPLTGRHFPAAITRVSPRLFSDNVVLVARKGPA